ncbi:hypothetical protein GCM10023172_20840 [Hymenobacter ginsengisoli]|uniref:Uncharacterized protein n=1 Tax=Hymenobacter ginsengisoli TaxID=1051626 RepID=A0ABP8QBV6_9BACT|nr:MULTISPECIES: hypothetical protein [unclassified Hymenobacter]MBO2031355.1 hypothetical protein [Hymenobacter sp. BT559]
MIYIIKIMKISTCCFLLLCVCSIAYGLNRKGATKKRNAIVHKREANWAEVLAILTSKATDQDTARRKNIPLPEVAVLGVKGVQEIGLTNLPQQAGYRGNTLDKMAVYIPHPATTAVYTVEAVTLQLHRLRSFEEKFEQGELRIRLCEAKDVDHPPGASLLPQDLIISPKQSHKFREGKQEVKLASPLTLPMSGLYVVAEWQYVRATEDVAERKTRSAPLAANLSMAESYTWTSIGDNKQTWQKEGEAHSLSRLSPYYRGKIYNALMGVKVKEQE